MVDNYENLSPRGEESENLSNEDIQKVTFNETMNNIDENDVFHDSWLDFYTEDKLENPDTILKNFKKNNWSKEGIDKLKNDNDDLQKIMEILPINEDDKPDTKNAKMRLIYLLNHGLFKWFQLAINSLSQSGVNCCAWSPYLSKKNNTYNKLSDYLNRYKKEKDEKFYQLIDNVKNIDINFDSSLFKGSETGKFLRNSGVKDNIMSVVNLAKWYFIQKIKDGQTPNRNIETFKNQLAYMLSTLEHECSYKYNAKYDAKAGQYLGYGQINSKYTDLRTLFAQWSGLNLWIKDKSGNEIKWEDIRITKDSFTEKNFSTFGFVYWMIYWHLSNGGDLDKYINDKNVNNPDFKGARKIEAGAYSPKYGKTANFWKRIMDDSSKID